MKWSMWLGLFTSTIHSQPITDAEKMAHLQTLTTGRANQAIAGYACNASMYTAALEELKRRFGRPDIIINDFVNQLQNYRPPTLHRRESYMEYSTFISNLVETFNSLGFTADLKSTIYVQFAVSKLHQTEQLQWTQHATSHSLLQPNLSDFNVWLRQFALACDHLPPQPTQPTSNQRQSQQQPDSRQRFSSTANQQRPTSKENQTYVRPPCPFDGQSHHPAYCPTYQQASIEDKHKMVSDKKICRNCLGNHFAKNCTSKHKCHKCQRDHHTSLHDDARQNRQTQFARTQTPASTTLADRDTETTIQKKTTKIHSALLETLPVTLHYNNRYLTVYALLDSGSTNTYINEETIQRLHLAPTTRNERLSIGGFNATRPLDARTVSLTLHPFGDNSQKFNVNEVLAMNKVPAKTHSPTSSTKYASSIHT